MKIKVFGDGNWGSALGKLLVENDHQVSYWKEGEVVDDSPVIVISVPTQAIREILPYVEKNKGLIVINSSKGIESSTHKLPNQIVSDFLGKDIHYFSLIGPSFAQEVMEDMPTLVNLGYQRPQRAELVKKLFQTPYFRLRLTKGVEAIELSGALKNVYAIACGLAEGLGFGANTRAKLIVLALEEIHSLIKELDYLADQDSGPGILGDLVLTATSYESRNYTFGLYLAKHTREEALAKVHSTVEGYNTALSIPYFIKKTGIKMPLASLVYNVIFSDSPKRIEGDFDKFVGSII